MSDDHAAAGADGTAAIRPSYETAREELVEVVRRLEAGGTALEESLALWERGEHLAKVCQEALDGARRRLDAAVQAVEAVEAVQAVQAVQDPTADD